MTKLLHISASPRSGHSQSIALARMFIEALAEEDPGVVVEEWDLWDGHLPQFGQASVEGKMRVFAGAAPEGPSAAAWLDVSATFERFAAADAYLFSVPMWNHGVPYILKQFIDVVSQPEMLFHFDPEAGYTGLLHGRSATVIYTSAVYGPDRGDEFGVDFQLPYFGGWLRWAGIEVLEQLSYRPNLVVGELDEPGRRAIGAAARRASQVLADMHLQESA